MTDRLSALLDRFTLRARVFFAGTLCGAADEAPGPAESHLHLLRRGRLACTGADGRRLELQAPALLFVPRPERHRLQALSEDGAELVCAAVEFGASSGNPALLGLPPVLALTLAEAPVLGPTLELLFAEGLAGRCGHQAAVDRLAELLVIQLLRHLMQHGLVERGAVAGLADSRLARALAALHGDPARAWTLAALAQEAGMSRARFAARFAEVVQTTPGDYLADWRISVAKTLLRRGRPVKSVAGDVGYASPAALSRAFARRVGMAPSDWAAAAASQPRSRRSTKSSRSWPQKISPSIT